MFIGQEYKEIVEKRYAELKDANQENGILDEKILGGIKLFIGKKPKISMGDFVMEDGTQVFIGEESVETVS